MSINGDVTWFHGPSVQDSEAWSKGAEAMRAAVLALLDHAYDRDPPWNRGVDEPWDPAEIASAVRNLKAFP